MRVLSVGQLNEQIKSMLESHFMEVWVEGEVSRPTYHTSGHLYFSLKDKEGVIKCVMFRSNLAKIPFRIEEGQKLIVSGRIGVYKPRGEYQLYAVDMIPSGEGSLQLAFNQLKERLRKKGYFESIHKKQLPPIIGSLALVTSQTGAALQDMLRIINKRWPLLRVFVIDTLVQGKDAAPMIAEAIRYADTLGVDAIVVGRGGGSLEDLWAFNEEVVADAIFEASTPIVSAVGHEIDTLISDYVADLRAPTPSAAMELILPDRQDMLLAIDEMIERMRRSVESILGSKSQQLDHLFRLMIQQSPQKRLEMLDSQIEALQKSMGQQIELQLQKKAHPIPSLLAQLDGAIESAIAQKAHDLGILQQRFETAMEAKKPPKGTAQVIKEDHPTQLCKVSLGDRLKLQDLCCEVEVEVLGKKEI